MKKWEKSWKNQAKREARVLKSIGEGGEWNAYSDHTEQAIIGSAERLSLSV